MQLEIASLNSTIHLRRAIPETWRYVWALIVVCGDVLDWTNGTLFATNGNTGLGLSRRVAWILFYFSLISSSWCFIYDLFTPDVIGIHSLDWFILIICVLCTWPHRLVTASFFFWLGMHQGFYCTFWCVLIIWAVCCMIHYTDFCGYVIIWPHWTTTF